LVLQKAGKDISDADFTFAYHKKRAGNKPCPQVLWSAVASEARHRFGLCPTSFSLSLVFTSTQVEATN
jgi:hypothetical protein